MWSHVHVLDVVEDECAWRAVAHHLLVDLVAVGGEQRLPVALVQAVRRHCVRLETMHVSITSINTSYVHCGQTFRDAAPTLCPTSVP